MRSYREIIFREPDQGKRDMLIAQLSELGYEGFEEVGGLLKAYIGQEAFDAAALGRLAGMMAMPYEVNTLQERNWNADWESSFSPVVVDGKVAIRAHFHEPVPGIFEEIVITPKMSFGTGHHATTSLMISALLSSDLKGKDVLDLGTGTGVLAILAERLGADSVLAMDNDPWSVENALENLEGNRSQNIRVELSDRIPKGRAFDVILANINKHILLAFCDDLCRALKPGGKLLLSGILRGDLDEIGAAYERYMGRADLTEERDGWLVVGFSVENK